MCFIYRLGWNLSIMGSMNNKPDLVPPLQPVLQLACAIVMREGRVLVQKRLRKGVFVYEFPTGKLEQSETFEQAAIRELREETGLIARGVCQKEVFQNNEGGEIAFVVLEVPENMCPKVDNRRQQTYYWYHWEEIPLEDFHMADRAYIRKHIKIKSKI